MKSKLIVLCAFLFILYTIICFAAGCRAAGTSAVSGGTVRYGIYEEPKGIFNPVLYNTRTDGQVVANVFSGLLRINPEMKAEPDLAESYSVSEDKRTVTYTLKKGLKWHDGQPITADDVVYTIETIAHPDYTGLFYDNISKIDGVEEYRAGEEEHIKGIKKTDERTIAITTTEPFEASLYYIGCIKILPKHIWSRIPVAEHRNKAELLNRPVGSGPFKIREYKPGKYVELTAYENYHFGRPNLDGLMFIVVNRHSALQQLAAGQLDILDIPDPDKSDLDYLKNCGISVQILKSPRFHYIGINGNNKMLGDDKVRFAFSAAVDRDGIVKSILNSFGDTSFDAMPKIPWAVIRKNTMTESKYDRDKAIELLREAGWEYADKKMYYNGKPIQLSFKYPPGNVSRERAVFLIQKNFEDIGISLELEVTDPEAMLKEVDDEKDFDLYMYEYINGGDPFFNLGNPVPSGKKWEKQLSDDNAEVFLFSSMTVKAYNPYLKEVNFSLYNGFYDIHKWIFA